MKMQALMLPSSCFRGYRPILWILFLVPLLADAQEKQSIQIKTFDEKLQVLRNVELSLNGGSYVLIGKKGTAIVELNEQDLPIKTITMKDEKLEAASWNLSKGIIEIIIRAKSYRTVHFVARFPNGNPAAQYTVSFKGDKAITVHTNQNGEFDLPIALNETIKSHEQFQMRGLLVQNVSLSEQENVLLVDLPKVEIPPKPAEEVVYFDLSTLDTITTLPGFYEVFRGIAIRKLDDDTQVRIDAKFNELMYNLTDSLAKSHLSFMRSISDTSFVAEDLKSLINYATLEGQTIHANRQDFETKIDLISKKLEKGIVNLDEQARTSLLADLDLLEQLLAENETQFNQNQNDYRDIINTLKEKYFDIASLETRLSKAEKDREEQQRVFRQRMIIIGAVLVVFAVLIVLLISFSGRMRKQAKQLKSVNEEIQTINDNLEDIVVRRTRLLEESNKELDTFLYRASHDLRGPIRSILGLFSISEHIPPQELVNRLKGTTLNMDRMLDRLITISEINQEAQNASMLNVREILDNAKSKNLDLIQGSGVQFHIDCASDLKVNTSVALLECIVSNLLENAIFFSTIKNRDHARVEIKAEQKAHHLVLSVYDNGVGIEDGLRPRLFDMFFVGHEKSPGNGLGLYTVNKCVQALAGKIDVDSKAGQYARFTVTIPGSPVQPIE